MTNLEHQDLCLKAWSLTIDLKQIWMQIRDNCVVQENQTDLPDDAEDGHTDMLNNEIYRYMYAPWDEYRKIREMMGETGTSEWLDDCTGYNSRPENNNA